MNKGKGLLPMGIGLFTLLFFGIYTNSTANLNRTLFGQNANVIAYCLYCVSSLGVALILGGISKYLTEKTTEKFWSVIYISFGLFVIGYLCAVYVYAPFHWGGEAMMAWNAEHYGSKILFLLLTAGLAGCLYMICDSGRGEDRLCVLYSVLLSFAGAVSNYAQNIFQPPVTGKPAPEYVIHHAHAYINSIINVAYYQPYDDVCCSIYGHYGIMYLPFVKILGNDTVAVFRTIALFTFVCFLLICYITRNFVHNRLYYCILITAMLLKGFVGDSFYFQGMPHRFLFIFLIIAWEIFARKKKMTKRVLVIVEFILGTLAILWNLEMGFVAVVSLALFHITGNGRSLKAYIGLCVKQLIYTIGCFVTAYVFVNMYNILVGGGWNSLGTFLYPFGGKDAYSVEDLGLPMMGKYAPFLIYLSVFFCLFLVLGRSLIWRRERATRGEERIRELFLIDVTALCHMCYFINRPVIGGEYCCYYYLCILLGAYTTGVVGKVRRQEIKQNSWKLFKAFFTGITLAFLSFQILAGGLEAGYAYYGHHQEAWGKNAFLGPAEYLRETVEKDTFAIGAGMPELYYQLGWDPQIHITDWSDMNDASRAEVDRALSSQVAFLMTENTDYENPDFVPYARLSSGDFSSIYYVRKQ